MLCEPVKPLEIFYEIKYPAIVQEKVLFLLRNTL